MDKCRHVILHFASNGLYVVCHKCERTWMAVMGNGQVDTKASEDGLGIADIRVVPDIDRKRT